MNDIFKLKTHRTTPGREALAGLTTFTTMAYIVIVNPILLGKAGMDFDSVLAATCLAAATGCLLMGLLANYPFALAPGMGLNAFFAFTVVGHYGYTWQQALAIVCMSGLLFVILTLTGARERVAYTVPESIRLAIPAGIGLFIALIGLNNARLVKVNQGPIIDILVANGDASPKGLIGPVLDAPPQVWELGHLQQHSVLLALAGLAICGILTVRKVKGAMLTTILAVTALSIVIGITPLPKGELISMPSMAPTFLQLDFAGLFSGKGLATLAELAMLVIVFSMVDLFDTLGTLIGTAHQGGFLDKDGKLPRMRPAMLSDALATCMGALLGTSTTTTYIESASGIAAGGRTGLTAVVTGLLFLVMLFLAPLARLVPEAATAPVLIVIGLSMIGTIKKLDFSAPEEYLPALTAIIIMPFTYSIANGIGLGVVLYVVLHVAKHGLRTISPVLWVLFALFIARFGLLAAGV